MQHPPSSRRSSRGAMRRGPSNNWEDDCIDLDDHHVVASLGGTHLQRVSRRILSYLLAQKSGGQPASSTAKASYPEPLSCSTHTWRGKCPGWRWIYRPSRNEVPRTLAAVGRHGMRAHAPGMALFRRKHQRADGGRHSGSHRVVGRRPLCGGVIDGTATCVFLTTSATLIAFHFVPSCSG